MRLQTRFRVNLVFFLLEYKYFIATLEANMIRASLVQKLASDSYGLFSIHKIKAFSEIFSHCTEQAKSSYTITIYDIKEPNILYPFRRLMYWKKMVGKSNLSYYKLYLRRYNFANGFLLNVFLYDNILKKRGKLFRFDRPFWIDQDLSFPFLYSVPSAHCSLAISEISKQPCIFYEVKLYKLRKDE